VELCLDSGGRAYHWRKPGSLLISVAKNLNYALFSK
jgi:hypothetical protein